MAILFVKTATELFIFKFKKHYGLHNVFFLPKFAGSDKIKAGRNSVDFLDRTKKLLSKAEMDRLSHANICVFGCGGVGGYTVEMLTRSGVGSLTVVDFDKVDVTNINRQIIATTKTVGRKKVDVISERCKEINPEIKINAIDARFDEQTKNDFNIEQFDFVVDAIDDVKNKLLLILLAKEKNVKIISAMGAGNKIEMPNFKICDIFKTENDGLAKKMRKLLKENGIKNLTVCCSNSKSLPLKEVGSIAYYPAIAGCTIACYVTSEIIKGEK